MDEAIAISMSQGMRLYETDCHLEFARLYLAMHIKNKARESLNAVQEMIEEMDYHRRDPEILIETARLYILEGKKEISRQTLANATECINKMGCHRWDIEVEELQRHL